MPADRTSHSPSSSSATSNSPLSRNQQYVKKEELKNQQQTRSEKAIIEKLNEKIRAFKNIQTFRNGEPLREHIECQHIEKAVLLEDEDIEPGMIFLYDRKGRAWIKHWTELTAFAKDKARVLIGQKQIDKYLMG